MWNKDPKSKIKKENHTTTDQRIEELLGRFPSGYSIEEIVSDALQNSNDEEKEELKREIFDFIARQNNKKLDSFLETKMEGEKNFKEKTFEKIKKEFTEDLIEEIRKNNISDTSINKDKKPYWVAWTARFLANKYFYLINKKPTKESLQKKIKDLKSYFYKKSNFWFEKFDKNKTNSKKLRNFYEKENYDDDELEDIDNQN